VLAVLEMINVAKC